MEETGLMMLKKMKYSHKNCIEPINLANASNADVLV